MDTVLILVGKQGRRKSMFFSVLGDEWFTDSPVDMESLWKWMVRSVG
ncbi:MAG TPA: VapE domain-containing protein [Archangium sp.]|nr:VapE domain-containing protein [Archangium sp.]